MFLDTKTSRPEHEPQGDPCSQCGLPEVMHRVRKPRPEHEYVGRGPVCEKCRQPMFRHRARKPRKGIRGDVKKKDKKVFIGIDGEGQGWYPHRYVLLAASDEYGENSWFVRNEQGLTTVQCLDFILGLPLNSRLFAYGFNYDLTKMLEDLPNELLYFLFRPELRQRKEGKFGLKPVKWGPYTLNLQGTKFTVSAFGRHKVIWDVWKFFQGKFVKALELWKVGTKEERAHMQLMKDKRGEFDKVSPDEVQAYCLDECRKMAELARKLVDAHDKAGLKLRSFYGAGSSAAAMLDAMKIKPKIVPVPDLMKRAVASAFFGGRFENSVIGTVKGPIHSYDISSAYPYQLCFLPCLIHSNWVKVKSRKALEGHKAALVRYRLRSVPEKLCWGPFPWRDTDGSICFPQESGGGWVWLDEYLAGEKLFPNVEFLEAWVCEQECHCKPFERIPQYYLERLKLGKEGPGIVIKLGCNSCYGKLAQSVGKGIYNSWIWAGMITSGCRAQVLHLLGLHDDPANMLMTATDGIQTREKLRTPIPVPTGTDELVDGKSKPLGGWEHKVYEQGVFFARPGIYFPLNPTGDDIDAVRARGIGKGTLLENWEMVIRCWEQKGVAGKVKLADMTRFCGAKTSISRSGDDVFKRSPQYGEWAMRPTDMSFNPLPKRERVLPNNTLEVRRAPLKQESRPYARAFKSEEAMILRALQTIAEEQPDL
jgi:hypothetical protein